MAITVLDSAGAAIGIGDSVKLLGTIAATPNPLDNRFNEVVVTLLNPVDGASDDPTGGNKYVPGAVKTITVHGTMITKV